MPTAKRCATSRARSFFQSIPSSALRRNSSAVPPRLTFLTSSASRNWKRAPGLLNSRFKAGNISCAPFTKAKPSSSSSKTPRQKGNLSGRAHGQHAAAAKDGKVVLDPTKPTILRAFSTPYATCPLPLKENILPCRVELAVALRRKELSDPPSTPAGPERQRPAASFRQ